jgi:hypothetical protein
MTGLSYTLDEVTVIVPELSGFRTMGACTGKKNASEFPNNDRKECNDASLTTVVPWIPGGILMRKPPMTTGNQRISMSGVLGPAVLDRAGTSLEDFELYGSLYRRAPQYYDIRLRDDRHLLVVVDTDKCSTRTSEKSHWPLSQG